MQALSSDNPLAAIMNPRQSNGHSEKGLDPKQFLSFHSQYPRAVLDKRRAEVHLPPPRMLLGDLSPQTPNSRYQTPKPQTQRAGNM